MARLMGLIEVLSRVERLVETDAEDRLRGRMAAAGDPMAADRLVKGLIRASRFDDAFQASIGSKPAREQLADAIQHSLNNALDNTDFDAWAEKKRFFQVRTPSELTGAIEFSPGLDIISDWFPDDGHGLFANADGSIREFLHGLREDGKPTTRLEIQSVYAESQPQFLESTAGLDMILR